MSEAQVVELVLIEGSRGEETLYVLDWEYDRANNKILYLKFFPLKAWMKGRRDHAEYIAPKGDPFLYARDESGYFSTSNRLTSIRENGTWYDEYGRPYTKPGNNISVSELKLRLFPLDLLEQLDEKEIIGKMKEGEYSNFNMNELGPDRPEASP